MISLTEDSYFIVNGNSIWHGAGNHLPKEHPRRRAMKNKIQMSLWLCKLWSLWERRFFEVRKGKKCHVMSFFHLQLQCLPIAFQQLHDSLLSIPCWEKPAQHSTGLFHSFLFLLFSFLFISFFCYQPTRQLWNKTWRKTLKGAKFPAGVTKMLNWLLVLITPSMWFRCVFVALY